MWQLKTRALGLRRAGAEREATAPSRSDAVKGAVDVGQDVLGLLDADRKAQEAVADPQPPALLGREPAVRGNRRAASLPGGAGATAGGPGLPGAPNPRRRRRRGAGAGPGRTPAPATDTHPSAPP